MNRLRDYIGFAVCFAGLGYIVVWALASTGDGAPFGAAFLCADAGPGLLDGLCHSARPLSLPLPLHVLGALSTIAVTLQILRLGWRRARRWRAGVAPQRIGVHGPDAALKPAPQLALHRLPRVKARRHFGLRGAPP